MLAGLWSWFIQDALVFWQSRFLKDGWWYRDRIGFYCSHEKVTAANAEDAAGRLKSLYGWKMCSFVGEPHPQPLSIGDGEGGSKCGPN